MTETSWAQSFFGTLIALAFFGLMCYSPISNSRFAREDNIENGNAWWKAIKRNDLNTLRDLIRTRPDEIGKLHLVKVPMSIATETVYLFTPFVMAFAYKNIQALAMLTNSGVPYMYFDFCGFQHLDAVPFQLKWAIQQDCKFNFVEGIA